MQEDESGIRKYRVTDIAQTNQRNDTSIVGKYFRLRPYIKETRDGLSDKSKEWLGSNRSDRWGPKWLGLSERGVLNLEFQNPYNAAYRMTPKDSTSSIPNDPLDYNTVFTIQISGCCYNCSYCYVPRENNECKIQSDKFVSAAEILDNFESLGEKKPKVIRISGGEVPSIIPELIIDVYKEMVKRNLTNEIYLFADTNLASVSILKELKSELIEDLKEIALKPNFGLIGCLKALGNETSGMEDFGLLVGIDGSNFGLQFESIDYWINSVNVDFYLSIVPIATGNKRTIVRKIEDCFKKLQEINHFLPLRVTMLHIKQDYATTNTNLTEANNNGRKLPKYKENLVLKTWYEKLLPKYFDGILLAKYQCQIPLSPAILFKSTARPGYKRLILNALGSPKGTLFDTYIHREHASSFLTKDLDALPSLLKGRTIIVVFSDTDNKTFFPLREFVIMKVEIEESIQLKLSPGSFFEYKYENIEGTHKIELLKKDGGILGLEEANQRIKKEISNLPPEKESWLQLLPVQCLNDLRLTDKADNWHTIVNILDRPEISKNIFQESIFIYLNPISVINSTRSRWRKKENLNAEDLLKYDANSGYPLNSGFRYRWSGEFYKPRASIKTYNLKFTGIEELRHTTSPEINILPARIKPFEFQFGLKRSDERINFQLKLEVASENTGDTPLFEIPAYLRKTNMSIWVALFFIGLFFGSLVNVLISGWSDISIWLLISSAIGQGISTISIMRIK